MYRGKRVFICDNCGKKFIAPDYEYCATTLSTPVPCPQCHSHHTMPFGLLSFFLPQKLNLYRNIYKSIWERIDKILSQK